MHHEGLQNKSILIDEALVKRKLGEVVRETVEETLNKLLDAEADELCKAGRYERSPDRVDTRAGSYERSLETKAGGSPEGAKAAHQPLRECHHRTLQTP
jgi:transposase-like protein